MAQTDSHDEGDSQEITSPPSPTPKPEAKPISTRYYSTKELATRLNVSRVWICRLLTEGRIKGIKPTGGDWRIPEEEVQRMVTEGLPATPKQAPPRPQMKIKVPKEKADRLIPPEETPPAREERKISWLWPFESMFKD